MFQIQIDERDMTTKYDTQSQTGSCTGGEKLLQLTRLECRCKSDKTTSVKFIEVENYMVIM